MKNIIILGFFIFGMTFIYLMGTFYTSSFDVTLWNREVKVVIVITWTMITIYSILAFILKDNE